VAIPATSRTYVRSRYERPPAEARRWIARQVDEAALEAPRRAVRSRRALSPMRRAPRTLAVDGHAAASRHRHGEEPQQERQEDPPRRALVCWAQQVPSKVEGQRSLKRHALDTSIANANRRDDA
jgi:hypothetical protein